MKKFLSIILLSLLCLFPVFADAKEDKAVVNVFYAEWCSNCTNLHKFLNELESDKNYNDMFTINYYRIDNEASYGDNPHYNEYGQLFLSTSAYFETDGKSIPFTIIGNEYIIGFDQNTAPDKIKSLIKEEYFNKDKSNIVGEIASGKIDVDLSKIKDDQTDETNLEKNNKEVTNRIGIIVIIITSLFVAAIIVISVRRK